MIFAATPNPALFPSFAADMSALSVSESVSDVSVREGGGAMAAPAPAVEDQEIRQSRYVNIDVMKTLNCSARFIENSFSIKTERVELYFEIVGFKKNARPRERTAYSQ